MVSGALDGADGVETDGCVPGVDGTAAELAQAAAISISIIAESPIAIFFNMNYSSLFFTFKYFLLAAAAAGRASRRGCRAALSSQPAATGTRLSRYRRRRLITYSAATAASLARHCSRLIAGTSGFGFGYGKLAIKLTQGNLIRSRRFLEYHEGQRLSLPGRQRHFIRGLGDIIYAQLCIIRTVG
jgi:hypothetical protein